MLFGLKFVWYFVLIVWLLFLLINWCLQWASCGFGLNAYRLPSIYLFTCILYVVGLLNVFFCSVMDIVAFFLHSLNVSLEHRLFSIVAFFSEWMVSLFLHPFNFSIGSFLWSLNDINDIKGLLVVKSHVFLYIFCCACCWYFDRCWLLMFILHQFTNSWIPFNSQFHYP